MEKERKFQIAVFDKLLLKNGQIINFDLYTWGIYFVNGKTCVGLNHEFQNYIYGMDIPVNEQMFNSIEVSAKVKLKCELIKK